MLLGYSTTQKGYKCFVPETEKVMVSRDVKFLENQGYFSEKDWDSLKNLSQSQSDRAANLRALFENLGVSMAPQSPPVDVPTNHASPPLVPEGENNDTVSDKAPESQDGGQAHDESHEASEESLATPAEPVPLRRSSRLKKDPPNWVNTRVYYNCQAVAHPTQVVCSLAYFPEEHQVFIGMHDQEDIPKTYEEAVEYEVWRNSVGDETEAMIKNHTWDESDLPKGKKAVSS
ncbi:unnamed protein product [Microthlaspi erraticum]|uniref:Retroviral polymerase SH3-like domain-containing protein n=1 Tax=Microthlaspi erraticum TaxID=1685480 RepID=A0A6D2IND1_9BRAS|nr:unnamed protein product [Microthlaspi erraticum]